MNKKRRTAIFWAGLLFVICAVPLQPAPSVYAADDAGSMDTASNSTTNPQSGVNTQAAGENRLPSSYDARDDGLVTSHKDQRFYGTCWAFAAVAAAESSLIESGLADQDIDLSEYHLAYFTYKKAEDPLGNIDEDGGMAGSDPESILNYGGKSEIAIQQLAKWCGPIYEKELPYINAINHIVPDASLASRSRFHLKNAIFGNSDDIGEIKTLILKYGAVAASYYSSDNYYKETDSIRTYYIPNIKSETHAVCVIGWDDNFPKEKFKLTPDKNGAWLCKDSNPDTKNNIFSVYRSGMQDKKETADGYLWISYDTHFARADAMEFEPADRMENNYQYDGCPVTTKGLSECVALGNAGAASCMNLFEAKCSSSYLEKLEAVSITSGANANYQITVYVDPVLTDGRMSGYAFKSEPVLFTCAYAGIYRIDLPSPVYLKKGDRFAIEISGDREAMEQFATSVSSCEGTEHMEPGQCYVGIASDGVLSYVDLYSLGGKPTPRIKAFTNPADNPYMLHQSKEIRRTASRFVLRQFFPNAGRKIREGF